MKKLENSKFSHFFIQIFFFTADDSFGNGFRIVFHEYNFGKMKIFSFNTEKVLKKYGNGFENVCKPCNYEKNSWVIIWNFLFQTFPLSYLEKLDLTLSAKFITVLTDYSEKKDKMFLRWLTLHFINIFMYWKSCPQRSSCLRTSSYHGQLKRVLNALQCWLKDLRKRCWYRAHRKPT